MCGHQASSWVGDIVTFSEIKERPGADELRMRRRKRRKWQLERAIKAPESMSLLLICVLLGAMSVLLETADCQSMSMSMTTTNSSTSTNSTSQIASLSSNMTAYMNAPPVQAMTNSSGNNNSMSQQQQHQQVGAKSTANTKGGGRGQPQVVLGAQTNSPAFNSRHKLSGSAGKQMRTTANASDNQMAADDVHETQAFMQGAHQSSASGEQQPTVAASNDGLGGKSTASRGIGKGSSASQGGWQTVSTSIATPSRPKTASAPKYSLPPPPPPLNYNNYPHQHQIDRATALAIAQAQQQQQQLAADLEATQLERPASGYSYGTPAYTHTSPLGPAKQLQMHAARQLGAQHSLATTTAAAAAVNRQNTLVPQMHVNSVVGSHAANPCKPPVGVHSMLGLQQQQQQQHEIQLLTGGGTNDLLGAATGDQNHLPRYLKLASGTRLRSHYIFKVRRADSLTDCELLCSQASLIAGDPLDTCRSFNYRPQFAAENCELSRSDARSLKLEDSSQFEHNTHSDFYALDPLRPAHPASLMQQQQQQESLAASDCLDVSQSCTQDGMEFTLRTNEPFRGRIYTYGFYDSCYYDGEGGTTGVLRISRSGGLPRCGTQQIGDLMTNIVVVQFNDFVQTTRDRKYNLTCNLSGPGEAVVTSDYLDTKIDERQHPLQIEHLPPQNVITSNVRLRVFYRGQPTNTIAVGDLLTFRLETSQAGGGGSGSGSGGGIKQSRAYSPLLDGNSRASSGDHSHEIFATNVLAKDPYSGRQVQLIDGRGCPVDPVNVFPELQRTPDGALESEFYAFKIPDSNFLIFQATVRTCKSPCEPIICQTGAQLGSGGHQMQLSSGIKGGSLGAYLMAPHQSSAPSWGRRRRKRSGEEEDTSELIGTGESIEHVIPVRLVGDERADRPISEHGTGEQMTKMLTRVKRPDFSEAEEEVKEMFRVYLSRAEMNNKKRAQQLKEGPPSTSTASFWQAPEPNRQANLGEDIRVCLTQAGYYAMLFSIISLSLVILSVVAIAFYVTRHAKFQISETLADSIF